MITELVLRFLIVGALAFGGGQAALPLVERLTVAKTAWLSETEFATAVGLAYATPGPVLIISAFVGYHVAGILGALAATVAVFAVPVLLAGGTAHVVARAGHNPVFQEFGRYAAAAAVGLLGVTVVALAMPLVRRDAWLLIASGVVLVAARRGYSPVLLLAASAIVGAFIGAFGS